MEFFAEKELVTQIGHTPMRWPLALLKELIDNALDASESAGTPPVVRVIIEPDAMTVEDDGPGLPLKVLQRSLDYSVRISDKSYYVSPTRGQQGNALKCVWAAPFVANGSASRVEVVTGGEQHVINVTLDRIDQKPQLRHTRVPAAEGAVQIGTSIRMHWPKIASYLDDGDVHDLYRADWFLLAAYATFNPHAPFALVAADDSETSYPATKPDWFKWRPSWPTSPHWYTAERLRCLIAAYIAEERAGDRAMTVRDFVAQFDGLTRTAKRKQVVAAAGLSNAWLRDLVAGDDVDAGAVHRLLSAIQAAARPVKPKALGVLGEAHLAHKLEGEWGCAPGGIRYKAVAGEAGGLPFVLELAFGVQDEDGEVGRTIIAGVNWSPAIDSPFDDLPYLLGEMRVDEDDPVTVIAHLAYPRPEFTDRGKGSLDLPPAIAEALEKCVRSVGKRWQEEKRRADRQGRLHRQQLARLRKAEQAKELSLKAAVNRVMEDAYLHASGNKADPANARQIMYAARPRVLELTGGKCWSKSSYFTQKLLPGFIEANPELTADWDVVFDARGRLIEPHTGRRIDLGTLEVRSYIGDWVSTYSDRPADITIPTRCPTRGPANRYRYVLFVEKEGFYPLLERHRIADRYDVAIMSTKGMSVTAARQLVDRLSEQGVTVLVLRDFDKAGFSIVHTLRTDSHRYKFRSKPNVLDIGLRLEDVHEWGLEPLAEPVGYGTKMDPRVGLRAAGATEEECGFLVNDGAYGRGWSGRRVELNAFTSPRFIEYIEHQFAKVGVAKVVPDGEALKSAYRRAWVTAALQEKIDAAVAALAEATIPALPRGLSALIARAVKDSGTSWDEALVGIVRKMQSQGNG
jgi:DNA topoisomerase VI subunit B